MATTVDSLTEAGGWRQFTVCSLQSTVHSLWFTVSEDLSELRTVNCKLPPASNVHVPASLCMMWRHAVDSGIRPARRRVAEHRRRGASDRPVTRGAGHPAMARPSGGP